MEEKRCAKCKKVKPVSEFGKDRRTKDGLLIYCRDCKKQYNDSQKEYRREYMRQYRVTYYQQPGKRDRDREYSREYRKTHPEKRKEQQRRYLDRLKSSPGERSYADYKECLRYFNNTCAYSGVPLLDDFHLDHIIPLTRGGTNDIHNIIPCLPTINSIKHTKDFETWYPTQPFYSEERHRKIREWMNKKEEA